MKLNSWIYFYYLFIIINITLTICENVKNFDHTDVDDENKFSSPCVTPNGEDGLCTEIQTCPVLMKAFSQGKSMSFIRESKCGPPNEDKVFFRVCCGKKSDFVEKDNTTYRIAKCPKRDKKVIDSILDQRKCGKQFTVDNRIVGGYEADLGEFPWMARLLYKNKHGDLRSGCSGFLIHPKYVLTAAHCINSNFAQYFGPLDKVQFGEHDTRQKTDCDGFDTCAPPPVEIDVANVIIHPGFSRISRSHEHDIALIELKNNVIITGYVRPICVLNKCVNSYELYISGWGATETDTSSYIKLKATVPRVSNEVCREKFAKLNKTISEYQTCAGADGRDSCKGDSGGPLMVVGSKGKWYAEGIVSYGIGCGDRNYPGVYTYLPRYYDWIANEINKP